MNKIKRLFSKNFSKKFSDYELTVCMGRIGTIEFSAIRNKYADSLNVCSSEKILRLNEAIKNKDNDEMEKVKEDMGVNVFFEIEKFTNELMQKAIVSIDVNGEEWNINEIMPQLQPNEIEWIAGIFAEVNNSVFDVKKKETGN